MLKVLIVDDEALVRVGIQSCIQWEKYDMEFVGQAEDGMQALSLIDTTKPDIVLTDILMPNMTGLELIEHLSVHYPHIKTIVLSCHNEMDAVKRAMKLGAEDYILKLSMKPDSLLELLLKVKGQVENERLQKEVKITFESSLRANKQVIKNNLYKKLIGGSITPAEFEKESAIMQVPLGFGQMLVIYGQIDDYYYAPTRSRLKDSHLLSVSFLNILKEGVAENAKGSFAELSEGEYLILLDASGHTALSDTQLTGLLQKINASLKRYLNITVTFSVGGRAAGLRDVPGLYSKAKYTAEYRFYHGNESIFFARKMPDFIDKEVIFDMEEEKLLIEYIGANDDEGVRAVIDRFFNSLLSGSKYHPLRIKTAVLNVLYIFKKVFKPYEDSLFPVQDDANSKWTETILEAETLMDIRKTVDEYVAGMMRSMLIIKGQGTRTEIAGIKRYVFENIDKNITLDDAAKFSNMSRSYFSYIFKKAIGESFTNFVNRTKMEKARELILKQNLKVYEAAEKVGIKDEAYFSKLFKKFIGVNPGKIKHRE
ncbi:response regulator transcription factor [Paenibacillus hamazuiensis]|uniref:response regulator transcription factor n=1 Tax=Paenibacillus hamazuiensis TaxID=2936508 RepID=UPI00200FB627|nr:response regulator [Paenibacillus hamazuiensis]